MNINFHNYLKVAITASLDAGREILNVYDSEFAVENKKDNSPLTLADKKSHAIISEYLKKTGLPVLSEEGKDIGYGTRKKWKHFWLVDPLDGTKEFIKRNGEFTVNIAIISNQQPVLGVIFIPITNELYFAVKGYGAFKTNIDPGFQRNISSNDLIKSSLKLPVQAKTDKFTVVCSRSHLTPETESFIEDLKRKHKKINYASKGSSLKLCLIAEGKADIYPRFAPTMEWDTAAGQALIEQAGGVVFESRSGNKLLYNKESLLNPWFIATQPSPVQHQRQE